MVEKTKSPRSIMVTVIITALFLTGGFYYLSCKGISRVRPGEMATGTAATGVAAEQGGGSQAAAGKDAPAAPPEGMAGVSSTRGEIEKKYLSSIEATASNYEMRLNGLVSSALLDLNAARKDSPHADLRPLADRYISAGRSLEAQCDASVYSLLEEFENELKSNSFPVDAAARARREYEAGKKERAAQLLTIGKP